MANCKKQILEVRQQTKLLKKVIKKVTCLKHGKVHVTEVIKADTFLENSFNDIWQ